MVCFSVPRFYVLLNFCYVWLNFVLQWDSYFSFKIVSLHTSFFGLFSCFALFSHYFGKTFCKMLIFFYDCLYYYTIFRQISCARQITAPPNRLLRRLLGFSYIPLSSFSIPPLPFCSIGKYWEVGWEIQCWSNFIFKLIRVLVLVSLSM